MPNGSKGVHYGRNTSGWFDQPLFEDWFISIALPFLKKRSAPTVIIGDNLCSHLSYRVIELCEENYIKFCFLPQNSAHLTQPLDVSVFDPKKKAWRSALQEWKKILGFFAEGMFSKFTKSWYKQIRNCKSKYEKRISWYGNYST
ncbi:hypothetical protein NQ314_011338 [Rhamnusium bicolor]|uniref:DDE-1 domain-containing protein n=1 Tax=Rhamnusium bicolor TaxID=1586634 RepID=A0AAV8XIY8_9CUCU|nr:hypothetical protein NQ314_011338 [Rhamnusium bicolor]